MMLYTDLHRYTYCTLYMYDICISILLVRVPLLVIVTACLDSQMFSLVIILCLLKGF